jgi:hypothetical protein
MYVCEEDSGPEIVSGASTSAAEVDDGRGRSELPASPGTGGTAARSVRKEVDVAIIGEKTL